MVNTKKATISQKESAQADESFHALSESDTGDSYQLIQKKEITNYDQQSDFELLVLDVLNDFEYTQRQEKKIDQPRPENLKNVSLKTNKIRHPVLFTPGALLGILGPCGLPGHIAHFYDLNLEIEKHIQNVGELGHERFVKAYEYFKLNLLVEAVFVYENKFMAVYRDNGQLIKNTFY